jgi:hypothetical protein
VHSLIHQHYADATARAQRERRAVVRPEAPHAPPGRLRIVAARALAGVAVRVDREAARRAIA